MEKVRVVIDNRQKAVKIPTGLRMLVRRCCNAVLRMENFSEPAEISVTFVDNKQIQELNKQYRNKDMPTDVLSFPMGENGVYDENHATGAKILGDIVISMETAVERIILNKERSQACPKEGRSRARDRGLVSSGWSPTLGGRERGSLGAAAFVTDGGELWLKEKDEALGNREVRWFEVEAHSRSSGGREMIPRWEEETAGFGGWLGE